MRFLEMCTVIGMRGKYIDRVYNKECAQYFACQHAQTLTERAHHRIGSENNSHKGISREHMRFTRSAVIEFFYNTFQPGGRQRRWISIIPQAPRAGQSCVYARCRLRENSWAGQKKCSKSPVLKKRHRENKKQIHVQRAKLGRSRRRRRARRRRRIQKPVTKGARGYIESSLAFGCGMSPERLFAPFLAVKH